tara:strand:+ start:116 stop:277 length:162 start_codon:yes stop_codon:yes gene_type:complete
MKILSYLVILLGLMVGWYALNIPAIMAGSYLILSVLLLGGGGFLFYRSRSKKK